MSIRDQFARRRHSSSANHSAPPSVALEALEARLLLSGTSYVVNSLADTVATDGVVTLREAIQAANANVAVTGDVQAGSAAQQDVITFDQAALSAEAGVASGQPLTITLGGSQLLVTDDLSIRGLGADVLTIDADGRSSVMVIIAQLRTEVSLTHLTLTGGSTTGDGGGIYNLAATVTLTDVTVSGNSAVGKGGGICNFSGGTVMLTNSTVSDNSSSGYRPDGLGGGIYSEFGAVALTNSTVTGNWARYDGGGIYGGSSGLVMLTNTTVSDNKALRGAGIYNDGIMVTLTNSTVSGNSISESGGGHTYGVGIFNNTGALTLTNSTVAGNSGTWASCYGGGIYNSRGTATLTNTRVVGNSVAGPYGSGGGLYNYSGTMMLTNSTVAGNRGQREGGIFNNGPASLTLTNTLVALNDGPEIIGAFANENSLVSVDPLFVRNPSDGGDGWGDDPTTPAVDESANDDFGDLRLGDMSMAINLGNTALAVDVGGVALTTDLGGEPRIADGQVDIGAYEYQGAASGARESLSTAVTTLADVMNATDGEISLREACLYSTFLARDVTFAPGLAGGTVTLDGTELYIYDSMAIDATPIGGLTIDAAGRSRVLRVAGSDIDVSLTLLTLTGGSTTGSGGGVYNDHATLTLTNSTVSGNEAGSGGGGIYTARGALTLTNVTVSGNEATSEGGGTYNYRSTLTLNNSTVSGNSTTGLGGGIYVVLYGSLANRRGDCAPLTVNDDIALGSRGTLEVDLLGTSTDTLAAGGAVSLHPNASLEIVIAGGGDEFEAGTHTLIEAAGGLTGTFGSVTDLGGYVSVNGNGLTYDYVAGTVSLTLDMDLNPGDANLDGATDVLDRIIWNNHNFTEGTSFITGDWNGDGATDVRDRIIWNSHNFTEATPAPVTLGAPAADLSAAAASAGADAEDVFATAALPGTPAAEAMPAAHLTSDDAADPAGVAGVVAEVSSERPTDGSGSWAAADDATVSAAQLEVDLGAGLESPVCG